MSKHRSGRSTSRPAGSAPVAGLPVNKNDEVMLDIIGMTHEGEGVGRVEGFTLFVQGALPGEKVRAKVLKTKKQYGYAKLLNLVEASSARIAAPCEIYDQCGGCQLQHMDYTAQLAWKRQLVVDNLERIGKLRVAGVGEVAEGAQTDGIIVRSTLGMDEPWRYRNKAQLRCLLIIYISLLSLSSLYRLTNFLVILSKNPQMLRQNPETSWQLSA